MNTVGPYLVEGKNKSASAYESGIVNKINGVPIDSIQFDRQLTKLVTKLENDKDSPNPLTPALHRGAAKGTLSPLWVKNGGIKKDSVTDIILNNHRVSVKTGKSQILANTRNEAEALLFSVMERKGYAKSLIKEIEDLFENFVSGTLSKADSRKFGTISNAKKELSELADANIFHSKARKLIADFFKHQKNIYYDLIQEALTGDIKFSDEDSKATHLMGISKDGNKLDYLSLSDPSTINMVMRKTSPDISFSSYKLGRKHTTKVLHYESVFRLLFSGTNDVISGYDQIPLTENIITDIVVKLKEWFMHVIDKVKEMISQGISALFEFLGFAPILTIGDLEWL